MGFLHGKPLVFHHIKRGSVCVVITWNDILFCSCGHNLGAVPLENPDEIFSFDMLVAVPKDFQDRWILAEHGENLSRAGRLDMSLLKATSD